MHLTPWQRMRIVNIYFGLAPSRSTNRAKITSNIAAQQNIKISEWGVKLIIQKWNKTSKIYCCLKNRIL